MHLSLVVAHGKENKDLYQGAAVNDGTWNGGFLEAIWVPPMEGLHWSFFGRYDAIRNSRQPLPDVPKSTNDEDQLTFGLKYTLAFLNRDEYALHFEYSMNRTKGVAFDGTNQRLGTWFGGVDFAF